MPDRTAGAWSPLGNRLFRSLWIATIVASIGTWMQDVGAGWLMTSLSSSPRLVALVEAADSLPVMLLALPAGALADIIDRRRLLIGAQVYLLVVAGHQVLDFSPSSDWPMPVVTEMPEPDVPVVVTIDYRIRPERRPEFIEAMQAVREMRRRNGAYFWQLVHHSEDPSRFIEMFMDESWVEHLRQHERVSVADREILQRAKQYLEQGQSTRSSHWFGERET